MAKIKKVLEINNEIDEIIKKVNCLNLKKSELMNERELILKSKDVEKSTMDSLKYKIKLKSFPYFQLIFLTLHTISEKWALFNGRKLSSRLG